MPAQYHHLLRTTPINALRFVRMSHCRMFLQTAANNGAQLVIIERFVQIVTCTELHCCHSGGDGRHRRDHDDWHTGCSKLEFSKDPQSIYVRQKQVEDDGRRRAACDKVKRGDTAARLMNLALWLEDEA